MFLAYLNINPHKESMLSELVLLAIQSIWFILPAYFANSTPVVAGGGAPIDFGRKMRDGEYVFGPGKTWRGAVFGILAGLVAAYLQKTMQSAYDLSGYGLISMTVELGFLLSFGALLGDIAKSFLKRRLKIKRGESWLFFDQLDFVFGALAFSFFLSQAASLYLNLNWKIAAFLVVFTPLAHRAFNILAYALHLKKVPW